MSFFSIFHEKPSAVKPLFGPKHVNSVKNNILGPKCQQDAFIFRFFIQKNNCSYTHILSKNVYSLRNTIFSCPYLSKNVHSHENTLLSYHFFQIFMKNPMLSCLYLVKKTSIKSKLHYIMGGKSRQDAFFGFFTKKLLLKYLCFIKKTSILNKTQCSHARILQKKRPILQKHCALMSFFLKCYMKNPLLSCPYLIKKTSILSNYIILWIKKVPRVSFFFRFFAEKSPLLCPYFIQETSILNKTHCSQVHI